ncbi:hypothetical protein ACOMHN_003089 [Nucella lapillus]
MNLNYILFSLFIATFASSVRGSPCDECTTQMAHPSEVKKYCDAQNLTTSQSHRCCVNSTASNFTDSDIIGIDLRNCSLENVTQLFQNMTSVVIISLEDNPLSTVTERNFYELTQLNYLSLPGKVESCPGGAQSWVKSHLTPDNQTLLCENQINACLNKDNNDTCPSPQSYCSAAGPGLVDCLCSPDYHGYKCLRKGTFPMVPFVSGICGSTFVAAIFLWVTQRRFVKKHSS